MTSTSSPVCSFFFKHPAPTEIYTLSLHDALPISVGTGGCDSRNIWTAAPRSRRRRHRPPPAHGARRPARRRRRWGRSEEHTSELQSRLHLVCRLLLEKKK